MEQQTAQIKIVETGTLPQMIYADRVINAGFGAAVSRLTLAMETDPSTFTPTVTIIMPTVGLLEMLKGVAGVLQENTEVKDGILKGLDSLREQINALPTAADK